jgi:glycosyltransferase involved in cell wall biosynthesis
MKVSVLLPIYHGASAPEIDVCLRSLVRQDSPAAEVIIARDGPVSDSVEEKIRQYESLLPLRHIFFAENRGLGATLNDSVLQCKYELIARVDADDQSLPHRFADQIIFLQNNPQISVVGGWMRERYKTKTGIKGRVRETPTQSQDVSRLARRRNPINHPTTMFRKSSVIESGNYQPCSMFEDYFLWMRMLQKGFKLANLPDVLVETDVNAEYFSRRGGIDYFRHELRFLCQLRKIGFMPLIDAIIFVLTRLPVRILPIALREHLYRNALRNL